MRSIHTTTVVMCLAVLLASPLCSCWGLQLLPYASVQRGVHISLGRYSSAPTSRLSCFIHDDTTTSSCSSIVDREEGVIGNMDIDQCDPSTIACSDHDLSSNSNEKLSGRTIARTIVLSSLIGLFMMQQTQQPSFGVADRASGLSSSALEQSVVKLETSSTRAGTSNRDCYHSVYT